MSLSRYGRVRRGSGVIYGHSPGPLQCGVTVNERRAAAAAYPRLEVSIHFQQTVCGDGRPFFQPTLASVDPAGAKIVHSGFCQVHWDLLSYIHIVSDGL